MEGLDRFILVMLSHVAQRTGTCCSCLGERRPLTLMWSGCSLSFITYGGCLIFSVVSISRVNWCTQPFSSGLCETSSPIKLYLLSI
jgi:hypothetical protein